MDSSPNTLAVSSKRADRASIDTPFATEFSLELSGAFESEETPQLEDVVGLDAEVLASLVIQLRTNLASAIKEREEARGDRDGLIGDLAIMQTRLQELEGAHEREVEMLNEMSTWRKRCEDAEEQVGLLRAKVEESRRAVMTLQTQSRRQSQLGVGYASPHTSNFAIDPSPRTPGFGKRTSLQFGVTPGTTTLLGPPPKASHRRQSSSSEPGISTSPPKESQSSRGTSPQDSPKLSRQTLEHTQSESDAKAAKRASHRQSAIYIRPTESLLNPLGAELENLRQELNAVRAELSETKHELWEANEAKEASDVCMRALKDFINENSIGASSSPDIPTNPESNPVALRGISLPPLPTDNIKDTEDAQWNRTPVSAHVTSPSMSKKGWGLPFWGSSTPVTESASSSTIKSPSGNDVVSPSSTSPALATKSPVTPAAAPVGSLSSFMYKWRKTESPITMPNPISPVANPSPSTSSPSTLMSAFRWNSPAPAPQPVVNDNYTPAPKLGNLKRRPSAYSTTTIDTDQKSLGRRESSLTSLRGQRVMEVDDLEVETIESPVEEIEKSSEPQLNPYVDSTPSLTDAETTAASTSGGSEPASPNSSKTKSLPKADVNMDLQEVKRKSSNGSLPRSSRRPTSNPLKISSRPPVPEVPIPTMQALSTELSRVPISPKSKTSDLPKSPLIEGKKRARSRATSNARLTPGMDTIEETSAGVEKITLVRQSRE